MDTKIPLLWPVIAPEGDEPQRKRPRAAPACQRCKTRKQKCDGFHPCSKCQGLDAECVYLIPQRPMSFGKNQYIKSLEHRVAELESLLSTRGIPEPSRDNWKTLSPTSPTASVTAAACPCTGQGGHHLGAYRRRR